MRDPITTHLNASTSYDHATGPALAYTATVSGTCPANELGAVQSLLDAIEAATNDGLTLAQIAKGIRTRGLQVKRDAKAESRQFIYRQLQAAGVDAACLSANQLDELRSNLYRGQGDWQPVITAALEMVVARRAQQEGK